jgi:imidazolonepropionase
MAANESQPRADMLIADAAQLLTCACDALYDVGLLEGGCVAIAGETIAAVGSRGEVEAAIDCSSAEVVDAAGCVVAPGFVDSHTHLVFGGSRVDEYAARMTESDPEALRRMGIRTGVSATVERTRAASLEELVAEASTRIRRMVRAGTTTVESKSGYGLSTEAELKLLRVNRALAHETPIDVLSTFLGAHGFPAGVPRETYLHTLLQEMTPLVAEEGLADFADVWCDDGYYTSSESRLVLEATEAVGMSSKIHADAYSYVGGSDLAAEMRMASVDHLNYTPRTVMSRLAESGVVGVVMPALDFAVGHVRPFDARAMIEEGMTLALATDLCPGCWAESQQFVMALACRLYGLSPAEALWAATRGGAQALRLQESRGSLEVGKLADLQVWDVPRYEHAIYRLGGNVVSRVIKRGKVIVERLDNEGDKEWAGDYGRT